MEYPAKPICLGGRAVSTPSVIGRDQAIAAKDQVVLRFHNDILLRQKWCPRSRLHPLWPMDIATLYLGFSVATSHRTEEGKELPESGNPDQRIDDTRKDCARAS